MTMCAKNEQKEKLMPFDKAPPQESHRCVASKPLSVFLKSSSCGNCFCAVIVFFVLGFPFLLWEQSKAKSRYFTRRRRDSVSISRKRKKKRCTHSSPSRPPSELFQRGQLVFVAVETRWTVIRTKAVLVKDTVVCCVCGVAGQCFFSFPVHVPAEGGQQKGASWRP